jgi:hypothetical protein
MRAVPPAEPDVSQPALQFAGALHRRLAHLAELATAEVRLAAISGISILLLVVLSAGFAVIGWALLIACALFLSTRLGLPLEWSALALAALHGILASYLWRAALRLSRNLSLPEVRSRLARAEQPSMEKFNATNRAVDRRSA